MIFSHNKVVIFISAVLLLIGIFVGFWMIGGGLDENVNDEVQDPAFLFYRDLGVQFHDCGSEDLNHGFGYNKDMRSCFLDAQTSCTPAKLHQKIVTIEGDPIFTTLVIEGDAPKGCAVHVYTDSRDKFGKFGISDTICFDTTFDTSSGQDSFLFSECEDGTAQYFY